MLAQYLLLSPYYMAASMIPGTGGGGSSLHTALTLGGKCAAGADTEVYGREEACT